MARTKNVARLPPSNASRGLPGNVQPDPGYQQPPRPKSQSSSQADETWLENAPDQQPLAALSGNEDKRNEDKKNEEDVVGDGGAEHDDSILMVSERSSLPFTTFGMISEFADMVYHSLLPKNASDELLLRAKDKWHPLSPR